MIEPVAANLVPGQVPDRWPVHPVPPLSYLAGAGRFPKMVLLPVVPTRSPRDDSADAHPDADAWLKLPRGIAFGLLLAAPCWVLLAAWLLW